MHLAVEESLALGFAVEAAFLPGEQFVQLPDECDKAILVLFDFNHGAQFVHAFAFVWFHQWWDVFSRVWAHSEGFVFRRLDSLKRRLRGLCLCGTRYFGDFLMWDKGNAVWSRLCDAAFAVVPVEAWPFPA
jgi:hypothetical protein